MSDMKINYYRNNSNYINKNKNNFFINQQSKNFVQNNYLNNNDNNNNNLLNYYNLNNNIKQYFIIDSNYLIWKIKYLIFPYFNTFSNTNENESNSKNSLFFELNLKYPEFFLTTLSFLFYIFQITFYIIVKSNINPYDKYKPDIMLVIILKNILTILLETILINIILQSVNVYNKIPIINILAYCLNKYINLAVCALFIRIKILLYLFIIYFIVTNVKIMQESFPINFNDYNNISVYYVLSIIFLLSNIISCLDLFK